MRILLVHNHYGSDQPSGEGVVFELERRMLERNGHEVATFERHSDEIRGRGLGRVTGLARGALATPWNPAAAAAMRKAVARFRPDVVHAHNTFPLISPSIFAAIEPPTARVLTLHNYRLFCAAAAPVRDGRVCTECLDRRSVRPALRHGCYRGSRLGTLPVAAGIALQRRRNGWSRDVDAFIALTEFQRRTMVDAGLPADRVHVKPNFQPGDPEVVPWEERDDRVVFMGRLTEEKGVRVLVDAWRRWGDGAPRLVLVGDGPLRAELEREVKNAGLSTILFKGLVPAEEARGLVGRSRLLVLPSTWFEGFPMVLQEAMAAGTPALVSRIGALPELVEEAGAGVAFAPGDAGALLRAARETWAERGSLVRLGGEARRVFEERYTEEGSYARLVGIYEEARERRSHTGRTVSGARE